MLETTWFIIWGVLWAIYFALDGFDLGMGLLMPALARNDKERQTIYHAAGPFWDGNEVWLITAGGVTFAAFPRAYAVMFSSLYTPLMLILFGLIIRVVGREFRFQSNNPAWRKLWDTCFIVGSIVPTLLLGVAFANLFRGLPLDQNGALQGGLPALLNPYGLVGGLLFLVVFAVHGATWLSLKSEPPLADRARTAAKGLWVLLAVVAVVFLIASAVATPLYENYIAHPILFIIPLLAVCSLLASRFFMMKNAWWRAWFASALLIITTTMFGVIGMFPNLVPSRIDQAYSMTITNSASSPLTLKIMLAVVLTFVPIIIIYQTWVYVKFRDALTDEETMY